VIAATLRRQCRGSAGRPAKRPSPRAARGRPPRRPRGRCPRSAHLDLTIARPTDRDGLRRWLDTALANAAAGSELPFATIDLASGRAIGSSRFLSIVPEHRRLEIGWTWVGRAFQRTGANREATLLQLTHAFEDLGANRVEFKTDSRNEASRAALLGIGATFEGIFRNHMVMPDGPLRHSAWYSVIAEEWPAVRSRLEAGIRR
jgi:RimJ/RimL family protein N-acetyltransferase